MPKRAWRIECGGCAHAHRLKFLFIVSAFYLGIIMLLFTFVLRPTAFSAIATAAASRPQTARASDRAAS